VIKTLRLPASPSMARALQQEVSSLKRLSSSWGHQVPRLLAEGMYDEETAVIVLDRVVGHYLSQTDRSLLDELLGAFQAIHRAGLVHGDVKYDNILVTPARRVVVVDFGLSRPADSAEQEAELAEVRALVA
jgi:tRNA A-37 threonylcarbamoyl transferase component Bud32